MWLQGGGGGGTLRNYSLRIFNMASRTGGDLAKGFSADDNVVSRVGGDLEKWLSKDVNVASRAGGDLEKRFSADVNEAMMASEGLSCHLIKCSVSVFSCCATHSVAFRFLKRRSVPV